MANMAAGDQWGSKTRTIHDSTDGFAIESVNGSSEHEHQENSNEPTLEDYSRGKYRYFVRSRLPR